MKQRGIMLLSTLMIMVVIAMIVMATIKTAPSSLLSASSYTDHQRAQLAADIGVNYAKSRFKEDMAWMGSPNSTARTVVRTADNSLIIVEDHGNVVGLVRFETGQYGQFRIRFNHQDGDGAADGLDNPSADYVLSTPLISQNNLLISSASSLYESAAQGDGIQARDGELVQAFQAYVAVEGRAGPGLSGMTSGHPTKGESGLRVVTKLVETRLQADFGDALDAAAMAAGDINAHLKTSTTVTPWRTRHGGPRPRRLEVDTGGRNDDDSPARIRAKGSVHVTSDSPGGVNLLSEQGFAQTLDGTLGAGTRANDSLTTQVEAASAGFYSMEWDRIGHANSDPSATDTVNLNAGTYVIWETGTPTQSKPEIHYYDMSKDDYIAHIKSHPSDSGTIIDKDFRQMRNNYNSSHPNGIRLITTKHTNRPDNITPRSSLLAQVVVRDDVYVAPTNETDDFTLMPRRGFIEGPPSAIGDPHPGEVLMDNGYLGHNLLFQFEPRTEGQAVLTSRGEVNVNAAVHGSGASITAEQDITIVGGGYLAGEQVAKGGDGLSLYSKGDVTVSTYSPRKDGLSGLYRDIRLKGVLYAWGDVNLEVGQSPQSTIPSSFLAQNGYLSMDGALVAYGGDPGDQTDSSPGSGTGGIGTGRGNINIHAHWATLTYDTRYLSSFDKTATPSKMKVISWTLKP